MVNGDNPLAQAFVHTAYMYSVIQLELQYVLYIVVAEAL